MSMREAADRSIVAVSRDQGLDPALLYETVVELADEGLFTARCLNAAAGILLGQLGLPAYFFRSLSKDALKRVLRAIAGNLEVREGEVILRSEVSEAQVDVDSGVQARIATPANRDRMEAILNPIMAGHRIEYYYGRQHQYYTYVIHPERCPEWVELAPGVCPFAFARVASVPPVPKETCRRYQAFLARCQRSVVPLVEVTRAAATRETRVMFREDFSRSILPVVRQLLADSGVVLNRAYWETYRTAAGRVESICSLYLDGYPRAGVLSRIVERLHALVSIQAGDLDDLYVGGTLTFEEYIFTIAATAFTHIFVHKAAPVDRDIAEGLARKDLRDALARRVFDSDRAEYTRKTILTAIREHPELVKQLYALFDRRFNPRRRAGRKTSVPTGELDALRRRAAVLFVDDQTGHRIFDFMTRLVTQVHKTSFFKVRKRSCAFRLDPAVLDPLVFPGRLHGVFFVVGFYAVGTHMRAEEIARGGLRLVRVTAGTYENELDGMPLLNYALGPVAQRLKHKDIAESGAKGVIVPAVEYAGDGLNAVFDVTEGIMDLVQPSAEVVDYLGRPEMVFFGPDEGTAPFMDAIAQRGRERRYRYWRTLTTGKSTGIPHDAYGLTRDGRVFGLIPLGEAGTELLLEGAPPLVTTEVEQIRACLEDRIDASGMTTMGVMACLRTVLAHLGIDEAETRLMMTGGPDGDLGANQLQSFRGRTCLVVDGGSVLFDPAGLSREELLRLALARHAKPRLNSLDYPAARLGRGGFRVPRVPGPAPLPGGRSVEDGAYFHRACLTDPALRPWVADAGIELFVPCGGLKDTINSGNVRAFLDLFRELRVIVEGANVFFDDAAREVIARETKILQIRDSSANKGGVTSSSVAEVLPAFLLGERYEEILLGDTGLRLELIRAVLGLIRRNAEAETRMLLSLHARTGTPLYALSVQTSEWLFALQERLYHRLPEILARRSLVAAALEAYVPRVLLERVGPVRVLRLLSAPALRDYRDALLTKSLAAMALYRHAADWEAFTARLDRDLFGALSSAAGLRTSRSARPAPSPGSTGRS